MRLVKQSHLIISTLEPTNDTSSLLAAKLSETEEKLKVVTAELESAQSETTNMTLLVKQSEETVANLKCDINNQAAQTDLLKTQVEHLQDSKVECEKQIAEEKGCVRTLTTTLREKDAHFFEHMQKISDLQKQVEALEGAHRLIDSEKETLNKSARDSENEVQILIEEVTNLKSELTALRTENEALSSEKTSSFKEKEKLTQEVEDLRNKLTQVEDNLTKTSEDQMIDLREQLRLAQGEHQTAVVELDQLRMDKDQVSSDCYALVAKLSKKSQNTSRNWRSYVTLWRHLKLTRAAWLQNLRARQENCWTLKQKWLIVRMKMRHWAVTSRTWNRRVPSWILRSTISERRRPWWRGPYRRRRRRCRLWWPRVTWWRRTKMSCRTTNRFCGWNANVFNLIWKQLQQNAANRSYIYMT